MPCIEEPPLGGVPDSVIEVSGNLSWTENAPWKEDARHNSLSFDWERQRAAKALLITYRALPCINTAQLCPGDIPCWVTPPRDRIQSITLKAQKKHFTLFRLRGQDVHTFEKS